MADEKKDKVLDAAIEAFIRHGFRRVTMGDIAKQAGMSRPALYLVFANKEEIFKAGMVRFRQTAMAQIDAGLPAHKSVAAQLRFSFEVWTVRPFEVMHDNPDAKDLTDCGYGFAREVVEEGYRAFETLVASILEPHAPALGRHNLTVGQVAHVLGVSARGFKQSAADVDELNTLIDSLIAMTLAALEG